MVCSKSIVEVPTINKYEEVAIEKMYHLLIGGNQLRVERVRGAQSVQPNSTHSAGQLEDIYQCLRTGMIKCAYLIYVMGDHI